MVRTVEKKYQVWLAGYYDDFNGARAIPDYLQLPSDTLYSSTLSHFGNPINGEASLNPRYRFSIADRDLIGSIQISGVSNANDNHYLSNNGIFEWLSNDVTRQSYNKWEGRIQLQYPDGHVANRYRFGGSTAQGNIGYQRFVNGHDSSGTYIVPVGDNDATFGRAGMKRFDMETTNKTNYVAGDAGLISTTGDFVQRAHLTGSWMGEKMRTTTTDTPAQVFAEVTSPSKQPFLCVQSSRKSIANNGTTNYAPTIIYDGALNTKLDRDVFTARVALRSYLSTADNWDDVAIRFEIGFPSTQAGLLNDTGYTRSSDVPAIDFKLNMSEISYNTKALIHDGSNAVSYTNDNSWIDVDFVFDYTNNKFKVYYNGTEYTTQNNINGAGGYDNGYSMPNGTTASNLYGWQMTVQSTEGTDGNYGYVSYLMLDRVGLVRYLTDDITTTDEIHIESLSLNQPVNGISNCNIKVSDDPDRATNGNTGLVATDYVENLKDLFVSSTSLNWKLLIFGDINSKIDRPIWRGHIDKFDIKQRGRSREISFSAQDSFILMGKQIPLWEVGQKSLDDNSQEIPYWLYDAQGFKNIMNLGASNLELNDENIGFESISSYKETSDQRTQLHSGLPIQMYNNEDSLGPNNIEDFYEGVRIIGFDEDTSSNTRFYLSATPTLFSALSTNFNIVSTRHTTTSAIQFNSITSDNIVTANPLSYNPESAKIIYIGKQQSLLTLDSDWVYPPTDPDNFGEDAWKEIVDKHPAYEDIEPFSGPHNMHVYFDADPNLQLGDTIYIDNQNINNTVNLNTAYYKKEGHKIIKIDKILSYFGNLPAKTYRNNTLAGHHDGTGRIYIWVVKTDTEITSRNWSTQSIPEHGIYTANSFNTSSFNNTQTSIVLNNTHGFTGNGTARIKLPFPIAVSGVLHRYIEFTYTGIINSQHTLTGVTRGSGSFNQNHPTLAGYSTHGATVYQVPNSGSVYPNLNNSTLLEGDNRFQWSKDTGRIRGVWSNEAEEIKNRANHALWMRDLPMSLWFQYHFGIVNVNYVNKTLPSGVNANIYSAMNNGSSQTISPTTTAIKVHQKTYENFPSHGVVEIWRGDAQGSAGTYSSNNLVYEEKFIYRGKKIVSGVYYLVGVKYIAGTYVSAGDANSTSPPYYYMRVQEISNDYKHLWLLWADMRNNGLADADGGFRKKNFGLQHPMSENYKLDMFYADQVDEKGNIDKFGSLDIGDDINIWNVDSTNDTSTGAAYSKPADYSSSQTVSSIANDVSSGKLKILTSETGTVAVGNYIHLIGTADHDGIHKVASGGLSNNAHFITETTFVSTTVNTEGAIYCPTTGSDQDLSYYHDWENKAGALLVVDASRFFNLNTNANSGKTGQLSGLGTDLGDYVQTRQGFPALIDNYWAEALPSYRTTGDLTGEHPSQYKLLSDVTLTDGLISGSKGIAIDDATKFGSSGVGSIILKYNNNNALNRKYYFAWGNKLATEYSSSSAVDANPVVNSSSSNFNGNITTTITNTGESHVTSQLKEGMLIRRTDVSAGETYNETIVDVISNTQLEVSGTWAEGNTYVVPVQLGKVYICHNEFDEIISSTLDGLERAIFAEYSLAGSWGDYGVDITYDSANEPDSFQVHSTAYPQYMLRLLMHLNGYIKNKNSGTFYESDKVRTLWNAAIMDTWLPPTILYSMYDINNVPITNIMTSYSDTDSNDSYGSMVDARGRTILSTIQKMKNASGVGEDNNIDISFSYLIGKDNRVEFRPKYKSNINFTRSNIKINSLSTKLDSQVTNIRVYYNNGKSFVDWPSTTISNTTRWKVLEYPKIKQHSEATHIAKKQYATSVNAPFEVRISPVTTTAEKSKMIDTGRYGYIADSYVALEGTDDGYTKVCNWTRLGTGGVLFNGMVNALDGNQKTSSNLYARYGISKDATSSGDVSWGDNYYWYGSGSISNAVQIVHIPNGTPFVSDNHTHPMRIWIDLKASQESDATIDTAEFTINVGDYSFDNATKSATSQSSVTVNVKHSGFYEIALPSTYSDTSVGNMVVSFNAEYCRALLRHRCGDPTHANILKQVATNTNTIFPLGMREYSEMGAMGTTRAKWYAPKILVTRDLSYTPATFVNVTDAGLGVSNENLVITNVRYALRAGASEELTLTLERDESITASRLIQHLFGTDDGQDNDGQDFGDDGGVIKPPISKPDEPIDDRPQLPPPDTDPDADENNESFQTSRGKQRQRKLTKGSKMSLKKDMFSGDGKFSILGQEKPQSIPTIMRSIEGMDVDIVNTSGTAVLSSEGYVFAGTGLQGSDSSSISSQEVSIETTFVVPYDVMSNRFSIDSIISHSSSHSVSDNATLYSTIKCMETGKTLSHNTTVRSGLNKEKITIFPSTRLTGMETSGNNIKVTITRKPNTLEDGSHEASIVLHNLQIKMHRAVAHSPSSSNNFSTIT